MSLGSVPRHLPVLQHLCVGCGACCDGTLFECLEIDSEEQGVIAPELLVVLDGADVEGTRGLMFPCPMHVSGDCSIYERRPSRCAHFVCKVYERLEGGETTWEEALGRVRELQRLCSAIAQLLGWEDGAFSTHRFRKWAADYPGGEPRARLGHPAAFMKYGALRVFMDRHFIREKQ